MIEKFQYFSSQVSKKHQPSIYTIFIHEVANFCKSLFSSRIRIHIGQFEPGSGAT
jgi:hypothetical protein